MKNDLFTLYLKHDENFTTISKFSLCELILKILYFENRAMSCKEIAQKLNEVISGSIHLTKIQEALIAITHKIDKVQNNKYKLREETKKDLEKAVNESEALHYNIYLNYFSKTGQRYKVNTRASLKCSMDTSRILRRGAGISTSQSLSDRRLMPGRYISAN